MRSGGISHLTKWFLVLDRVVPKSSYPCTIRLSGFEIIDYSHIMSYDRVVELLTPAKEVNPSEGRIARERDTTKRYS